MGRTFGRLSVALAILAGVGLASETVWPADPSDEEIARVLMPAEGDALAVRQFKETGKNPYNKEPYAIEQGFRLARAVACTRSEEHTSELQSRLHLVCRLLLEKKKTASGVMPAISTGKINRSTEPASRTRS